MAERPKEGADPDATVMIPAGGIRKEQEPDADATVMIPSGGPDPDSTVMMREAAEPDPDATVMVRGTPEPDADATVAIRGAPEPDADATVMISAADTEPAIDPDATVAIPTPGRRRDAATPVVALKREVASGALGSLGGLNPLVAAANPILAVVPQIRQALRHPDPQGLRARLREGLDAFERDATAAGCAPDAVATASRALCALLDESAGSTPWGRSWLGEGLFAERQGKGDWSEGFFAELEALSQHPGENLALLEFLYVCLALGFEGRYRGMDGGRDKLAEERLRLRELLRTQHPLPDGELSARWRGLNAPARKSRAALAFWAVGSGAALVLVLAYLGFSVALGIKSDPVAREIAQLKVPEQPAPAAAKATAPTPAVAALLEAEIARGAVGVTDAPGRSTILIRSDQLFASGSARIEPAIEPVVQRIAEALDRTQGTVVVTGHTDDVPIRTARFPSNWELSAARAESVVKLMAAKLKEPGRLRAEGLADSEPVAPNDSTANRARNRRVAVILRSAP
jgi:type VI secretion system protein ImpK